MMIPNNNFIVLHFNPFDTFSKIELVNPKTNEVESFFMHSLLNHGLEELVDIAYSKNNFDIFFNGPIEYLPEFRDTAREIESQKYSTNKIKIQGVY